MNNDLLKTLSKHFDQNAIETLGQQIGAPREQTHSAINAALPVLVGMLARNNQSESGHQALARAVEKDHDGSILEQLGGFLSQGNTGMGEKILGHVFGSSRAPAETGLAEQTGLQSDQIGKMMALLAPVVMGALGQQARASSGSTAGSIGDLLQGSMGDLLKGSGGQAGGNVLGQILGGSGADLGDLARAGSSLLGGLFKR
jgi:hypothetical protein